MLVHLIHEPLADRIEAANVKQRAIWEHWLPPSVNVITAVQKPVDSGKRVKPDDRNRELPIQAK